MDTLARTPVSDRLRHALGDVATWERAGGVLTLTMAVGDLGRPRSAAAAEVARGLDELERRRAARRSAHVARTLRSEIESRSARDGGGGLAAVADLHTGRIVRLPAEGPLPTRLRVGRRAELRPLLQALLETIPAEAATRESGRDARRRRASELLATARSLALRGGPAVLGVEATIEALEAERVSTLLLPVEAPIPGLVSTDGTMTALRRGGPTSHVADPQLADAMIRAALAQHAEIELVDELEHGEAAALLRW